MSLFRFLFRRDKSKDDVKIFEQHPDFSSKDMVSGENKVRIMFMENYGTYLVHHYINGSIDSVVTEKDFREAKKIANDMLSGQKYIVV